MCRHVGEPSLVVAGVDDVSEHVHGREVGGTEVKMNHTHARCM